MTADFGSDWFSRSTPHVILDLASNIHFFEQDPSPLKYDGSVGHPKAGQCQCPRVIDMVNASSSDITNITYGSTTQIGLHYSCTNMTVSCVRMPVPKTIPLMHTHLSHLKLEIKALYGLNRHKNGQTISM